MNTQKLKPCPFCGGEAVFRAEEIRGPYRDLDWGWIECQDCYASSNKYEIHGNRSTDQCREEVTKEWNCREHRWISYDHSDAPDDAQQVVVLTDNGIASVFKRRGQEWIETTATGTGQYFFVLPEVPAGEQP